MVFYSEIVIVVVSYYGHWEALKTHSHTVTSTVKATDVKATDVKADKISIKILPVDTFKINCQSERWRGRGHMVTRRVKGKFRYCLPPYLYFEGSGISIPPVSLLLL